jgi:hypothetical protein
MVRKLNIVEDPESGDLLLDLTEELCSELGWVYGDTIQWKDNEDGTWTLEKINASPAVE